MNSLLTRVQQIALYCSGRDASGLGCLTLDGQTTDFAQLARELRGKNGSIRDEDRDEYLDRADELEILQGRIGVLRMKVQAAAERTGLRMQSLWRPWNRFIVFPALAKATGEKNSPEFRAVVVEKLTKVKFSHEDYVLKQQIESCLAQLCSLLAGAVVCES